MKAHDINLTVAIIKGDLDAINENLENKQKAESDGIKRTLNIHDQKTATAIKEALQKIGIPAQELDFYLMELHNHTPLNIALFLAKRKKLGEQKKAGNVQEIIKLLLNPPENTKQTVALPPKKSAIELACELGDPEILKMVAEKQKDKMDKTTAEVMIFTAAKAGNGHLFTHITTLLGEQKDSSINFNRNFKLPIVNPSDSKKKIFGKHLISLDKDSFGRKVFELKNVTPLAAALLNLAENNNFTEALFTVNKLLELGARFEEIDRKLLARLVNYVISNLKEPDQIERFLDILIEKGAALAFMTPDGDKKLTIDYVIKLEIFTTCKEKFIKKLFTLGEYVQISERSQKTSVHELFVLNKENTRSDLFEYQRYIYEKIENKKLTLTNNKDARVEAYNNLLKALDEEDITKIIQVLDLIIAACKTDEAYFSDKRNRHIICGFFVGGRDNLDKTFYPEDKETGAKRILAQFKLYRNVFRRIVIKATDGTFELQEWGNSPHVRRASAVSLSIDSHTETDDSAVTLSPSQATNASASEVKSNKPAANLDLLLSPTKQNGKVAVPDDSDTESKGHQRSDSVTSNSSNDASTNLAAEFKRSELSPVPSGPPSPIERDGKSILATVAGDQKTLLATSTMVTPFSKNTYSWWNKQTKTGLLCAVAGTVLGVGAGFLLGRKTALPRFTP